MTPLSKARSLLEQFAEFADDNGVVLPTLQQAMFYDAETVVPCESVLMGIISIDQPPEPYLAQCNPGQVGTFNLVVARACSWESEDDGTDNPEAVIAVADIMDVDTTLLWDFALLIERTMLYRPMTPSVSYVKSSGLAMTVLQFTLGID